MKKVITHFVYAENPEIESGSVPNPPVDIVVNEWMTAWKPDMSPMVSSTISMRVITA
jgi:hypothetical protein